VLNDTQLRNKTVDVAKGVAGVFVVLGHTLAFRYHEGALLQLTHLTTPLYIFLSGVFINVDRPWRQSWIRLFDALLKPYFVVLLALACWLTVVSRFHWSGYLLGMLYGTGATIVLMPLWFLPHLFLCRVVGKVILHDCGVAQSKTVCMLLASIFWCVGLCVVDWVLKQALPAGSGWSREFMMTTHWPGLPFSADVLPLTLACLLAGYALSSVVRHCRFNALLWAFSVGVIAVAIFYGAAFDVNRRVVVQPLGVTALVIAGLYAAITGAAGLARWRFFADFFAYFGRYFLLVLLLHLLVLRSVFHGLDIWWPDAGVWQVVWMFVGGMVLSLLLVEIVRRSRVLSALLLPLPRSGSVST